MKIAIIGCGIAGTVAALFLKQMKADVTLFEQVEILKPVGAGFLLQPAGLEVLAQLNLVESLYKKGAPIYQLLGMNHRQRVVLDLSYADLNPAHIGLGMHRQVIYAELMDKIAAENIPIRTGCQIIDLFQDKNAVFLKNHEGKLFGAFDAVVIADGARSTLRQKLTIQTHVMPYLWGALWTTAVDKEGLFSTILEQKYKSTHTMIGILPIRKLEAGIQVSFFWSMHESQYPHWQQQALSAWKSKVLSLWPELENFLTQFTHHEQFAFARYADVRCNQWHDGRVVVIGDAAHGMSPQLGQGANLSLIDAKVLKECFISSNSVMHALQQYSTKRKHQLGFYQMASRFVTPWFQSSSKSMGYLRDLLHGYFCKMPLIKQQMLYTLACKKTGFFSSEK